MPFDHVDLNQINKARRSAVAKSIRPINTEELQKLGEDIFDSPDHPWREKYFQLITGNPQAAFYHAEAGDGVIFLYDRDQDVGLWCLPQSGMGPLSANARQIMKEAIGKSH